VSGEALIGPRQLALASRGRRLAATLIDFSLFGILVVPLLVRMAVRDEATFDQRTFNLIWLAFISLQWSSIATSGKTYGKRMLRICVVRADGQPVDKVSGIAMRSWIFYAFLPFWELWLAVFLLDSVWIFSADRRCLHDRLAGTVVVIDPPVGPAEAFSAVPR
jgi:uncharacterized RDD family membrane protein YckC